MKKKSNKKCAVCYSNFVQKWGIQHGSQRYRFSNCGFCFVQKNDTVKAQNSFVWFEKWVLERQVYKYLVRDSKMSPSKLQSLFKSFLKSAPTVPIKSKQNIHLLIDATYFPNKLCLDLYYDYDINYVQLYRNTDKEKFKEIKEDLENLKRLNVQVYNVTCDGYKAIL